MYMNQLTIIGFTGQDAEFHYTPNRTPVATISLATKESWKNELGEWQSGTEWHRVVAFGKTRRICQDARQGFPLPTFWCKARCDLAKTRRTA
jgi:single stranded DNA-binding protein